MSLLSRKQSSMRDLSAPGHSKLYLLLHCPECETKSVRQRRPSNVSMKTRISCVPECALIELESASRRWCINFRRGRVADLSSGRGSGINFPDINQILVISTMLSRSWLASVKSDQDDTGMRDPVGRLVPTCLSYTERCERGVKTSWSSVLTNPIWWVV